MKTYCLTIPNTPRNAIVQERFKAVGLNVEMFYGVHGDTIGIVPTQTVWDTERNNPYRINPGKTSITISKMLLWQRILDRADDVVLILENDVVFCNDWQQKFSEAFAALPDDWNVAHVGHCCTDDKPTKKINDFISQIKYPLCCHAILWKKEAIRQAYEAFKIASWGTMSDVILQQAVYPKLNHYCFTPALIDQEQSHSEAGSMVNYKDITPGWFDWERIYDEQLTGFGVNPAVVVEVGSFLGRSTAYMADEIKRRLKANVTFYAVDHWRGSANEPAMQATIEANGGDLFPAFWRNMQRCGVSEYVKPIQKPSVEAAATFPDGSIDFVFIDGDHAYESVKADLAAWRPKIHRRRSMAGHDIDRPGVRRAVDEAFPGQWRRWESCWVVNHVV